jgi:hypothetical protein
LFIQLVKTEHKSWYQVGLIKTDFIIFINIIYVSLTVNWNGFSDKESGILGYTVAVGTSLCGDDVYPHYDPQSHLTKELDQCYQELDQSCQRTGPILPNNWTNSTN